MASPSVRTHTVIAVSGAHGEDGRSRTQTLQDGAAVHGAVEDGRVVVDVQQVKVDPYGTGQTASVPGLDRQDVILLRLVVQRPGDVEHPGDRVQEEGGVLVVLLHGVRDLTVRARVGVAGQNRRHNRTSMRNTQQNIHDDAELTNQNQGLHFRTLWSD